MKSGSKFRLFRVCDVEKIHFVFSGGRNYFVFWENCVFVVGGFHSENYLKNRSLRIVFRKLDRGNVQILYYSLKEIVNFGGMP